MEDQKFERITEGELAELKATREAWQHTRNAITDAWLTIQKCNKDLVKLEASHDDFGAKYKKVQDSILTKYGEVNIDLQTGIITYKPESKS